MADDTQTPTSEQDWSNYWQGRAGQQAGAALVGVGVETNPELEALWKRELQGAKGSLLDIACGAGTVLRVADGLGIAPLQGIDISADALTALSRELPEVETSVADAAELPFADKSFGTVTSQFGIEYADSEAFNEALRVLARDGLFVAVCHHADGAIAAEVRAKRDRAQQLSESGFTGRARDVFAADSEGFATAARAFRPAQDAVLAMAKAGNGLAAHLYSGTQQLHARKAAYAPGDISAWFDNMDAQIAAFLGRMQSMLDAALSEAEARELALQLGGELDTVALGGQTAAWLLTVVKA